MTGFDGLNEVLTWSLILAALTGLALMRPSTYVRLVPVRSRGRDGTGRGRPS
ncbi:MAG: hypothetical protein K2Y56_09580 [Methylobacterium sp.]|uniref:hypothetical protein n=1 Tax=Methylobacterium sp. TaxID=409 RepID=UPI0025E78512|nr:hypothetical protein [Methylobacterium sp.]MBX9931770.1 hypothetical protein [Methylobacterium sp.]